MASMDTKILREMIMTASCEKYRKQMELKRLEEKLTILKEVLQALRNKDKITLEPQQPLSSTSGSGLP
jgi:polyhydroxyalkanoate synthesis regulator phasin